MKQRENKLKAMFSSIITILLVLALVNVGAAREKPKIIRYATGPVGGANHAMAVAISDLAARKANYKVEVTPTAGEVFVKQLNSGKGFDIGNLVSITQADARDGTGPFKIRQTNLRLVTLGAAFIGSWLVRNDSDVKVPSDLKGKRVAGAFAAQPALRIWIKVGLANAGLTEKDVIIVPVPSSPKAVEAFIEGRLDSHVCMPIMPIVVEADAKIGARFISMDTSPEAVKRMREVSSVVGLSMLPSGAAVKGPTWGEAFYNGIIASSYTQEDVTYTIAKIINEGFETLKSKHGGFKRYSLLDEEMPLPVPYHEGAVKYYIEAGLWTDVMKKKQKEAEEAMR